MASSPFVDIPESQWIVSNAFAFAIWDRFPVSPGHALVTRRTVTTWFEADPQEQVAILELVKTVKKHLDATLAPRPDGYNVGFNAGVATGQTVMHLHVHVIPRYAGDVEDPRGGVRFVIPDKANYLRDPSGWVTTHPFPAAEDSLQLSTGHPHSPLWEQLSWRIAGARSIDVLASFVQPSGLEVIESAAQLRHSGPLDRDQQRNNPGWVIGERQQRLCGEFGREWPQTAGRGCLARPGRRDRVGKSMTATRCQKCRLHEKSRRG